MSAKQLVEVPYGKYRGNEFSAPQRLEKITNITDRQNAIVIFGVLMLHYYKQRQVKLMEVDELVTDGVVPYWRLCVYGMDEPPSSDKIRTLAADMEPVKPLKIFFESSRQSQSLVKGVFLTHALTVHMPSLGVARSPTMKQPTALEILASDHVDEYPSIVNTEDKHSSRKASLLRRKPVKRTESKEESVRRRFSNRSLLAVAYDTLLGVSLESVLEKVAAREEASPEEDDFDQ